MRTHADADHAEAETELELELTLVALAVVVDVAVPRSSCSCASCSFACSRLRAPSRVSVRLITRTCMPPFGMSVLRASSSRGSLVGAHTVKVRR